VVLDDWFWLIRTQIQTCFWGDQVCSGSPQKQWTLRLMAVQSCHKLCWFVRERARSLPILAFAGAQFSPAGVMYPEVTILHRAAMIGNKGTNPHLDPQRFCAGEHCLILLWNCCGIYDHGGTNFASGREKNKSEPHCLLHGGTFTLDMH
jgi:hypothetical protein